MTDAINAESPHNPLALEEETRGLINQFRDFLNALWLSEGRRTLTMLTITTVAVICVTVVVQVGLNAWNKPFYDAVAARNLSAFFYQLLVFVLIAGSLLILNVAQTWLREMIKLKSREWLTRDLVAQWLKPGRAMRLTYAGEIGINPDQRIHEDTRRLTELTAEIGIGLFQATLLLVSFLGVLWSISGPLIVPVDGMTITIPGYMVWCALLYALAGSWLSWRVGRPLIGFNAARLQRESELRFALVQANQHVESIAHEHLEDGEKNRLNLDLDNVLGMIRKIVGATARLTWITAGYGWIANVAPIVIAAPEYFAGRLTFGELMVVVGGFYQVNQSLRWFVDNFSLLAEWRATLFRVMSFREALMSFESRLGEAAQIEYGEHPEPRLVLENIGVSGLGVKAKLDSDRIDIAPGERILVLDRTRSGKNPLLPAIAGHWPWGSGKVKLPGDGRAMFLGPKPYFPKGSLRATLAFPQKPSMVSDSDATAALDRIGLGHLKRSLDRTARWWRKLSPDDQMRLALARLLVQKPKWVFAEGIIDSIAEDLRDLMQSIFENELAETALISVSRCNTRSPLCRRVIHLTNDGPHETKAA